LAQLFKALALALLEHMLVSPNSAF